MVVFEVVEVSADFVYFSYYPKGNRQKYPGTIQLDLKEKSACIVTPAVDDQKVTDENGSLYIYAEAAMKKILKAYNQGISLNRGIAEVI